MKQINLLPKSVQARTSSQKSQNLYLNSFLVALAMVGGMWLFLQSSITNVQTKKQSLASEVDFIRSSLLSSKSKNVVDADVIKRANQINTLSKDEIDWMKALAKINSLVPKEVVLSSYSYAASNSSTLTLKMTGDAPSNLSFANFFESLQRETTLTQLKTDSYVFMPATGRVTFSISFKVPVNQLVYKSKI